MSKLKKKDYEDLLAPMLKELSNAARWISETGQRLVILFEGRDTAGKGTSIHLFAATLNPRQCKVVALPAPSERERGQWYFQRYAAHLPAKGEIALFDRSWYNRAGVEPVMGFCTEAETDAFLAAAPQFERQLVDEGVLLFKYWLCCDQDQQEERFAKRLHNPLRRWKLSPVDIASRGKYDAYTEARERMLAATHTDFAPWTLVDFNNQRLGRLTLLRDLLDRLPDTELPLADIDWPDLPGRHGTERYRRAAADRPVRCHRRRAKKPTSRRGSDGGDCGDGRSGLSSARPRGHAMGALRLFARLTAYYLVLAAIVWLGLFLLPGPARIPSRRRGRSAHHPTRQGRARGQPDPAGAGQEYRRKPGLAGHRHRRRAWSPRSRSG